MGERKNKITLALMASSIVLLLVLQFLWLKSAYRDAGEDFRRETNLLFRNTIFAMHDSLVQKSLLPADGDSLPRERSPRSAFMHDTIKVIRPVTDGNFNIKVFEKSARIEIITSSRGTRDSVTNLIRPIMRTLQGKPEKQSFIFRMLADSLNIDSIRSQYRKVLEQNRINALFEVRTLHSDPMVRRERTPRKIKERFSTEAVPFSPVTQYAATFTGIESLLLRKISPQILFAVFLTALTGISFYVMYRNLRAQQKLMQIKNDFISNITHELKTPVATVSVALEALKNFHALDNPQKTTEYLEIAQSELNRLTLMTDKILKTSVYEDQGVELKFEPVQVDTIIDQVIASMKLILEKKRIQFSYAKRGTAFTLQGSQEHLTNVFFNLVDNALKYSSDGASLDITIQNNGTVIRVSIRDSGVGIAPEYQKKIFEKFFRVPSGDVHNTKGYGLGLSYVASVIESHGGNIHVESEVGKGSCFIIEIPVTSIA